jgi:hypothetical protein
MARDCCAAALFQLTVERIFALRLYALELGLGRFANPALRIGRTRR